MVRILLCVISMLCLVGAARPTFAERVPIVNAGFENPSAFFLGVPIGWELSGDVSTWNINASPFGFWSVPAPEGNQVGTFVGVNIAGPASASQVVGTLQANVTYTLSGFVGHPIGWGASRGTVFFAQLWAGTHLVASTSGTGAEGRFQPFQVAFDSTGSTFVGLPLRIVIGSNQAQTSFDDITLDATAVTTNAPPTAVAGANQSVRLGTPVQLDGSGSFDDNTATEQLEYAWSFESLPPGSAASLSNSGTSTPSFVPDLPGSYVIQLVVTDQGGLSSAPSQVSVSENPLPVAHAGLDQLVIVGSVVTLAGSANDPDGDALTYAWTLTDRPAGSGTQVYNPTAAEATFVPDRAGTYVAQLTVSDFVGPGEPDTVVITATTAAGYVEIQLEAASSQIINLPVDAVTNRGNQNALSRFLINAAMALQEGDIGSARHHLAQAIARTDGCALRGSPDGNGSGRDWLVTCEAQNQVYSFLRNAAGALPPQ
jgi:hypothetical protein